MGALSPDSLVRVNPLEKFVNSLSPCRWVGESDSTRNLCGCSVTSALSPVDESDSTVNPLLPDKLIDESDSTRK